MAKTTALPTDDLRANKLRSFTRWADANITGDEKSEAHIFLDRLFQAFGHAGCLDVGGKPEYRIKKKTEDRRGTSFADYVWKPVVLIEMKKRGEDLSRHLTQALDYWIHLAPGRPAYTILCNFDEFWIYDLNQLVDEPLDKVTLNELPDHYGALRFLFKVPEPPIFRTDRLEVTCKAADLLANCFNKLKNRKSVDREIDQLVYQLYGLTDEEIAIVEAATNAPRAT